MYQRYQHYRVVADGDHPCSDAWRAYFETDATRRELNLESARLNDLVNEGRDAVEEGRRRAEPASLLCELDQARLVEFDEFLRRRRPAVPIDHPRARPGARQDIEDARDRLIARMQASCAQAANLHREAADLDRQTDLIQNQLDQVQDDARVAGHELAPLAQRALRCMEVHREEAVVEEPLDFVVADDSTVGSADSEVIQPPPPRRRRLNREVNALRDYNNPGNYEIRYDNYNYRRR